MKKKWIAGIMAAVMGIGMLTGCGSKKEEGEKEAPSEVKEANGEDVTLKVVLWD